MSIPVLSVAAMRDWEERSWSQGIDPWDVIAQVGKKTGRSLPILKPGRRQSSVVGWAGSQRG